jgi:hypothetical protein
LEILTAAEATTLLPQTLAVAAAIARQDKNNMVSLRSTARSSSRDMAGHLLIKYPKGTYIFQFNRKMTHKFKRFSDKDKSDIYIIL